HRHGPLDPLLATVIRTTPARTGPDALARRLAALDREQFRHDLRHGALPAVQGQLERDEPPPWDEILAMLDEGGLPLRTRDQLAAHPHCPEPVAAALLDRDSEHTSVPLALVRRSRAYALLALDRLPVVPDWMRDGDLRASLTWSRHALDAGTLTPADLFTRGRPAHAVLRLIEEFPRDLGELSGLLAAEVRRHRTDSPDAWAVTAALLDDFAGTLPELLGTAAAATAPIFGRGNGN
ncbi:MAG: hypothetical protein HOV68_31420, partial [Streptomycetaceae bacterium]|nr:hypothetical protein [Streptomycetaceae bacterium]